MSAATERFVAAYRRNRDALPGHGLAWLERTREASLARFAEQGLPTTRQEDWKYTALGPVERREYQLATGAAESVDLAPWRVPGLDGPSLVFVDGRFVPSLSELDDLPDGLTVSSLGLALGTAPELVRAHLGRYADADGSAFTALNTAFAADGALVHVAPGITLEAPLEVLYLTTVEGEVMTHPRGLVVVGAGSRLSLVETYGGLDGSPYLTNAVTEVVLEPDAELTHYRLQREGSRAAHIARVAVGQARGSRYVSHAVNLGAALFRADIHALLAEEGADCELNGLYLASGRQHSDTHTRIDHARPRASSRELYRGVLEGRGRAVFNGKVVVHPHAVGTDAQQANHNLLLSRDAEVDTKPELEIYADDVKCSHGATVGQLDADALFYLRSRGIAEPVARSLLTYAFAGDVLQRMGSAAVRRHLQGLLMARLPGGAGMAEMLA
jgi:Fe-S cluster assembly protein SufD